MLASVTVPWLRNMQTLNPQSLALNPKSGKGGLRVVWFQGIGIRVQGS